MKSNPFTALCNTDFDFHISDIFPESWTQGAEFSMYKSKPRPISALFFISSEHSVTFTPTTGGATVTAQRGDVLFIPKGSLYRARRDDGGNSPMSTYTVNLNLFDENGNELLLSPTISILSHLRDNRQELFLKRVCDAFHRIGGNPQNGQREIARAKGEFFLLLDLIGQQSQNEDFYYPIRRGVDAFCEEWNQNERIEKYALMSEVSVTYFYRCFRKWSGRSPVEYRNVLRLSHAETLLRCTDMKIQDISRTVGFDDPFYFCRIFATAYGTSPHNYRKEAQQN